MRSRRRLCIEWTLADASVARPTRSAGRVRKGTEGLAGIRVPLAIGSRATECSRMTTDFQSRNPDNPVFPPELAQQLEAGQDVASSALHGEAHPGRGAHALGRRTVRGGADACQRPPIGSPVPF